MPVELAQLWLPSEAAAFLQLTPGHLANLRCRREGPRYVKLGGAVRYRATDVAAWCEAQTVD